MLSSSTAKAYITFQLKCDFHVIRETQSPQNKLLLYTYLTIYYALVAGKQFEIPH